MEFGRVISTRAEHPLKALKPIDNNEEDGSTTERSEEQSSNVKSSIDSTKLGITIDSRADE